MKATSLISDFPCGGSYYGLGFESLASCLARHSVNRLSSSYGASQLIREDYNNTETAVDLYQSQNYPGVPVTGRTREAPEQQKSRKL